ncbi:MAG: 2-methylisocitrate lyase [Gammaproteobacteria bacterium]|nr:2-methylisocitrate lyase [Gammaproteobacteria bacterium]
MTRTRPSIADKRRTFRKLHESGCFVIPNPWDAGSARYLQDLGFKALASTSSGLAWSLGRPDNGLPRERVLAHLRELVEATDVPVNADFENGFAADASAIGESVRLAVETGVAGLSIEDSTGREDAPLFRLSDAVERLRAARKAIDASGGETLLVARAECFVVGRPDLGETIARLKAYADAGADCLYAPGLATVEQIGAVIEAVKPHPVNVLVASAGEFTLDLLAGLGVRRVSVGGALARAAWGGFMRAARLMAHGSFEGFAGLPSHGELDALFNRD